MDKHIACLAFLAFLTLALVGCPFNPPMMEFTSADTLATGRAGEMPPIFDGVGAGAEDGEGGSVETTREVVEPDVIRRQDDILYILNQYRGLTLVDLESEEVLAQVPTYGYPRDLYFHGGKAYVLVAQATDYTTAGDTISYTIGSRLYVVDVSDPESAAIEAQFPLEGDLVDSRMVGDVLYAVGAEYQWIWYDAVLAKEQSDTSWVTSIDLSAAPVQADQVEFDGAGTVIQASSTALFVATPQWETGGTTITNIDISDPAGIMAVRGSIAIAGSVADRFKLDAWDGVLRVVSSGWTDTGRKVFVTTIDLADPDQLEELAHLELEDAFNETLFATRFDGPRAYIVTYFVVDPLFVLDLSDPEQPALLGSVEVPGWSTHIEPRGDRLITLGVDDTEGRKVSVSVYDVSGTPQRLDIETFGEDWAWSSAYSDVKAFTVLDDLIIVPFSGWNTDFGGYDRLQFISLDGDVLTLRGTVDLEGQGVRSFEHEDSFFGVTQEELAVIDGANLDDLDVTNRISLAEDVADLVEVGEGLLAEIVRNNSTGGTLVRVLDGEGGATGEVVLELGYFAEAHAYGDSVILVGTTLYGGIVYEGPFDATGAGANYKVARILCPADAPPTVAYSTTVEVDPYYGFYWWPMAWDAFGGGVAEAGMVRDAAFWGPTWYPFTSDDRSFLLGDTLALRCYAQSYDAVVGAEAPAEGLALVDLDAGAWDTTVGLGIGAIVSMNAVGDTLVVCTKEDIASGTLYPECAYYVQTLDPVGLVLGERANVPGTFVQYDPATDILVLRDQQWVIPFDIQVSLRSVQWDGAATATAVDELALPQFTYRVVGQGSYLFIDSYDTAYNLHPIAVGDDGSLTLGATLEVAEQWGSLLDARDGSAYVSLGGNAIAKYTFTGAGGALDSLVPVMGYPSKIRFNPSAPVAILGYAGWAAL